MSFDLCKRITLNRKNNVIKCCVASSNVFPKTYTTCEFCKNDEYRNYSFEDKLINLYENMQNGSIQISSINDNTEHFEYAMCKVREYTREHNIDSYNDLYERKSKLVAEKLFNLANIVRSTSESETDRDYENWKNYRIWADKQGNDFREKLENKVYLEVLWEIYGETYKVWKKALEEQFEGEYRIIFDKNYEVLRVGKYNRGYDRFSYTSYLGQGLKTSYKKAYILKYDMGKNRNLEIVKNI